VSERLLQFSEGLQLGCQLKVGKAILRIDFKRVSEGPYCLLGFSGFHPTRERFPGCGFRFRLRHCDTRGGLIRGRFPLALRNRDQRFERFLPHPALQAARKIDLDPTLTGGNSIQHPSRLETGNHGTGCIRFGEDCQRVSDHSNRSGDHFKTGKTAAYPGRVPRREGNLIPAAGLSQVREPDARGVTDDRRVFSDLGSGANHDSPSFLENHHPKVAGLAVNRREPDREDQNSQNERTTEP
jgi:hypothetical protein